MIEMVIDSIRASTLRFERIIMLKEKSADRYLPIWIGPAEANAIAIKLRGLPSPRPITSDLLCNILSSLSVSVSSMVINDLRDDTFYAKVYLEVRGQQMEIDARPSDAIAIAVRMNTPIFASEAVLNKAGISPKDMTTKQAPEETKEENKEEVKPESKENVSEKEMEQLSAFTDFINNLNLDDFEKHKS